MRILLRANENITFCKLEYYLVQMRILFCRNHNSIFQNRLLVCAHENIVLYKS